MVGKQAKKTWMRSVLFGMPAIALVLSGCADDAGSDQNNGTDTGPLYAISTVVWTPDFSAQTNYVKFAPSLEADAQIDESRTIEVEGQATLAGIEGTGEFFIAAGQTGRLTKYAVDPNGTIQAVGDINFSAHGINSFRWPAIAFASKTKAYLWDDLTLKAFVWDPSTMTITGDAIDLSAQFDNKAGEIDYWTWREGHVLEVGSKLMWSFHYFDLPSYQALPHSGMLIIDTETDQFSIAKHATCGGLHNSMLGPDGLVYAATGCHVSSTHRAGTPGVSPPCMVRLDPEKGEFDETFLVDLNDLAGGQTVGGLIENEGSFGYIRVLNEELIPQGTPMDIGQAISVARAWETHRIDLTKPTATTLVDTPVSDSMILPARTDGRTFIFDTDWGVNKSTVLDVSVHPPTAGLVGDGWFTSMLRVR